MRQPSAVESPPQRRHSDNETRTESTTMANKECQKSQIRPPLKRGGKLSRRGSRPHIPEQREKLSTTVYTVCLGFAPPFQHLGSPIGELDQKGLIGGFGDLFLYRLLTILSFQIEPSHRCHQPVDLLCLVHEPKAHDSDDDGDDAEDDGG
jgi:hypothetical protein